MRNPLRILIDAYRIRRDPIAWAMDRGVSIGENCRLFNINPRTFGSEPWLIRIGNHVTITSGVRFINHDGGVWVFRDSEPNLDAFGTIEIGDNVFVGMNALLMPNIKIGSNVVVGAGSIVTRDLPDNCVAVGCPAKPLKSLSEYRESLEGRVSNIRNMPLNEKRELLVKQFWKGSTPQNHEN